MKNTTDNNVINQVLALTGLTIEQYNEMLFNTAEQYLTGFAPQYPQVVTQVLKDKIFWNWWRTHWEKRDLVFIESCYNWDEGQQARLEVYHSEHDARALLTAIYLSGQVLEESFAALFGKITDNQHQQYKMQEGVA